MLISASLTQKVETIAEQVPFSSSVVDSIDLLHQVVGFWNDLDWPDLEDYYAFMITLIKVQKDLPPQVTAIHPLYLPPSGPQYITEAALYYADEVYETVADHVTVDKTGKFNVTVQLCIILNNMQHIRDKFWPPQGFTEKGLMEELKLETFFAQLDGKQRGLGEQARGLVKDIVENAAEDMQHKILVVTMDLGQHVGRVGLFHGVVGYIVQLELGA